MAYQMTGLHCPNCGGSKFSEDQKTCLFCGGAVASLKGKKAFLTQRSDIDKAVAYLNAALMIEPRGIYNYFLAYIRYDYFERKYLNVSPNWQETLQTAAQTGVSEVDITQLAEVLQVEMPECLLL